MISQLECIFYFYNVIGWRGGVSCRPLLGERWKYFLGLPLRASFSIISGGAMKRVVKSWRTADAARLFSHYPVGLGEADTQNVPMSMFVNAMSRNR